MKHVLLATAAIISLAGCSTTPTVQTEAAYVIYDGLERPINN